MPYFIPRSICSGVVKAVAEALKPDALPADAGCRRNKPTCVLQSNAALMSPGFRGSSKGYYSTCLDIQDLAREQALMGVPLKRARGTRVKQGQT